MEINGVPLKVKIKELVIKWLSMQQMYRSDNIDLRSMKIFFKYQEWLNVISNAKSI
jgi:hypothetical protein